MQDALRVFLVNTKKIVEDNRRPHPPKSLGKFVDIADGIDVKGIASLQAIVSQQRRHEHEGDDNSRI